MRIAIVGSGVSGLVAAYRLHPRHEVTVFEEGERIGGHVNTVDLQVDERQLAVDTGFAVYNEATYPLFTRLLRELRVPTQPAETSFGISCQRTGLEWASHGLRSVFAQPSNLWSGRFLRLLRDVRRFDREASRLLETGDEKVAIGDYLCGAGYSAEFVDGFVVPMGAALGPADPAAFLRLPAATLVRFLHNHGLLAAGPALPWRVVQGGSQRYVDALTEPFWNRIRTRSPVRAIRRQRRFVEIATPEGTEPFDRVVLACHGDQALRVLVDPSGLERALLRSIPYRETEAVLHTDASLLPRSPRARASWNYRIPRSTREGVVVTYDMNRLQRLDAPVPLLVTLGGADAIDPGRVLRHFTYRQPVFDAEATRARKKRAEISGQRLTHYAGAYWGHGFHEDAVRSATQVCDEIEAASGARS